MALIPLRPLLNSAIEHGYAFGAFNVNFIEQAKALIEVHEMYRSALILQGADLGNGFMGGNVDFKNATIEDKRKGAKIIGGVVQRLSKDASIPIVLHLDHGKDFDSVKAAIDGGYTSVMIDGSHLKFEDNVELTREVVKYAHKLGVTVEGELGILAGIEDDVFSEKSTYTNPMKVCEFVKKTGVDCLAVSYGTKHGAVKGDNVKLRKEIVIASRENLRHEGIFGALVSHGSSIVPRYIVEDINRLGGKVGNANGIPLGQLQEVIPYGIAKINIDTDIRLAVTRSTREYIKAKEGKMINLLLCDVVKIMEEKPEEVDPRVYLAPIIKNIMSEVEEEEEIRALLKHIHKAVQEVAGTLVVQFGSVGSMNKVKEIGLREMAAMYSKEGL